MNDQNDDSQSYALMVLAGVVALVIAGVIALAVSTTMPTTMPTTMGSPAARPAAPAAAMASKADAGQADGRVYFDLGSAALPADAAAELDRVATAARAGTNATVLISGYHDATGDAAQNAELAKERAQAVRHALEANGVAPDRLVMAKPVVAEGGTDPREARRVELRLR